MATHTAKKEYYEAVGRRKTAIARVRLFLDEKGGVIVNDKAPEAYFKTPALQKIVEDALHASGVGMSAKVTTRVKGGGVHAQAEAIRHGISRALLKVDADNRKTLKHLGFLKRDPRMKERRKFGLKKARKSPQWAKR